MTITGTLHVNVSLISSHDERRWEQNRVLGALGRFQGDFSVRRLQTTPLEVTGASDSLVPPLSP